MRALVLVIVFLVGCQKPNEITNSTDSEIAMESITKSTDSEIVLESITNSIGMKLVLIPAGTFTMGSPVGEGGRQLTNLYPFLGDGWMGSPVGKVGRQPNETPHEVTISKSYHLGVYEVTQGEYEKVMGKNPDKFRGAKDPIQWVSWSDAVSFCKKLSEMPEEKAAGRSYRLTREAEWEYACRAGSTTAYCFGDSVKSLYDYAWFVRNSEDLKHPLVDQLHPVGLKKPNRWGLYDMHGNVGEWCQDWYDDYPSGAATDPQGPKGGTERVHRGGSWLNLAGRCRSAFRDGNAYPSGFSCSYIGFRVAISLP